MASNNTVAEQLLEFLRNNADMDSNTIAENLVEFLTNTVNMTSIFYDIFLNPEPMTLDLQQFNDDNELITVTIPNRALDRQNMILKGAGNPEGQVEAVIGTMYIDLDNARIYCKTGGSTEGSDTEGWTLLPDEKFVSFLVKSYLANTGYVTMNMVANYLTDNKYVKEENVEGGVAASEFIDTHDESRKKFWTGTQEEYDSLVNSGQVDSSTLYFIVESSEENP